MRVGGEKRGGHSAGVFTWMPQSVMVCALTAMKAALGEAYETFSSII